MSTYNTGNPDRDAALETIRQLCHEHGIIGLAVCGTDHDSVRTLVAGGKMDELVDTRELMRKFGILIATAEKMADSVLKHIVSRCECPNQIFETVADLTLAQKQGYRLAMIDRDSSESRIVSRTAPAEGGAS